jgi:negative regulator of sigma E activity
MTDPRAPENLSALLDGELDPDEVEAVERALREDPALRAELHALQGAMEFTREHGPVEPPAGFAERLNARIDAELAPPSLFERLRDALRQLPWEGLALAAAGALVLFFVQSAPQQTPATTGAEDAGVDAVAQGRPAVGVEGAPALAPAAAPSPPPAAVAQGPDAGPTVATPDAVAQARPRSNPSLRLPDPAPSDAASEAGLDGLASAELSAAAPADPTRGSLGAGGQRGLDAAMSYRLRASDKRVLSQLSELARLNGGQLIDASTGEAMDLRAFDSATQAQVVMRVRADRVTAATTALRRLGELQYLARRDDLLYGSGAVDVAIDVQLSEGSPR